jgi:hypothetical protein
VSFLEEAEYKELRNSCAIDEIPWISGFNSQMPPMEDVESVNSFTVDIPLTLGFNSEVPCSLAVEASPFHVIFNLNEVLIATRFIKGFHTIILHLGLKEFLEKCLAQFHVYIWYIAQHHNIYNYLD